MKPLKRVIAALLILSQVFLTGCWNYREIDTLAIIAGFAIDKGEQGHKYHLTFEMLDFSSGGIKQGSVKPRLLETEGDTIFDAVRNAIKKSEKKFFFSHFKVVVISQDLAREGIAPLMDWLTRDSEPRNTADLVISKEKTARDILFQKAATSPIVSYEIDKALENDALHLSKAPMGRLYQAIDMLYGNGVSLSLPAIAVSSSQSGDTPELDGTAVFKKDKLIGYLSGDETKNFLFVENKIKGGLLLVSKETKDKNIALEILDSHTEVTPQITGGKLSMHISIQTKTALGDVESPRDYETEEGIKALETAAGRELAAGIGALISKVQRQYDSDIFGFGKAVYQDDPQRWSEIKSKWDEMFQTLPVTVSVQIKIQNTATAKSSVKAGD